VVVVGVGLVGGLVVTVVTGGLVVGDNAPVGSIIVSIGGMSKIDATCGSTTGGVEFVFWFFADFDFFVVFGFVLVVELGDGSSTGNVGPDVAITVVTGWVVVVVDEPTGTGASVGTLSCRPAA